MTLFIFFVVAPEVMCKQPHGVAVDYFAVGVMAYEFMLGRVREIMGLIRNGLIIRGGPKLDLIKKLEGIEYTFMLIHHFILRI